MLRSALYAGLIAATASCLVEVDYSGTRFSCVQDVCPPGFECSEDFECVLPGEQLGNPARELVVDNSGRVALTGFPLLVRLDATRIDYADAGDNGELLRFFAADRMMLLPHEIDRWDPSGESQVWVRVDLVADSSTTIVMSWGDPSASSLLPSATWDSYVGVWHLSQDPASGAAGAVLDSTAAGNHATATATMDSTSQLEGPIAGALRFTSTEAASAGDLPAFELPVYSWSMWIRGDADPTNDGNGQPMFNADQQFNFSWDHTNANLAVACGHNDGTGFVNVQIGSQVTGQVWYLIAGNYDGTDLSIYLDGVLERTAPVPPPIVSNGPFAFGNDPAVPFFAGALDEVRVSGVARPADWFELSHLAATAEPITFGDQFRF